MRWQEEGSKNFVEKNAQKTDTCIWNNTLQHIRYVMLHITIHSYSDRSRGGSTHWHHKQLNSGNRVTRHPHIVLHYTCIHDIV